MKKSEKEYTVALEELVDKLSTAFDADMLAYIGPIARSWDDWIIDECKKNHHRTNIILLLTTLGGDAHAAYRIARCLQQNYRKDHNHGRGKGEVIIFVNSVCASAGTLLALAADKLIVSDHAELGPLDVQLRKPDEVGERTSGLTPIQALNFLEGESGKFFQSQFQSLRFSRNLSFSTKMAADIAAQMASGLLSNLYEQIDPIRLAEYDRLNQIASEYGERIKTNNVKPDAIDRLLSGYPSHEFCIDCTEAKELFNNVESPSSELEGLGQMLKPFAEKQLYSQQPAVFYLSKAPSPVKTQPEAQTQHEPHPPTADNGSTDTHGPNGRKNKASTGRKKAALPATR
ncbi:MAG: hypothetical protein U1F71_20375 [Verrucomicrobiaceae bacterium]